MNGLQEIVWGAVLTTLGLSFAPALWRLARGPELLDRVVALEVMATLGVALTATLALEYRQAAFLDVAVVLALISFVGTVAFAAYVERRARR